jgi:hypothetical protein
MSDKMIINAQGNFVALDRIAVGANQTLAARRLNEFRDQRSASLVSEAKWSSRTLARNEKAPLIHADPSNRWTFDWAKWGIAARVGERRYVQEGQQGRRGLVPASSFTMRVTPDPKADWAYDEYRITRADGDWFWLAVSWDWVGSPSAGVTEFAVMTMPAGADLKSFFTLEPMTVPAKVWERCRDMTTAFCFPMPPGTWKVESA